MPHGRDAHATYGQSAVTRMVDGDDTHKGVDAVQKKSCHTDWVPAVR